MRIRRQKSKELSERYAHAVLVAFKRKEECRIQRLAAAGSLDEESARNLEHVLERELAGICKVRIDSEVIFEGGECNRRLFRKMLSARTAQIIRQISASGRPADSDDPPVFFHPAPSQHLGMVSVSQSGILNEIE